MFLCAGLSAQGSSTQDEFHYTLEVRARQVEQKEARSQLTRVQELHEAGLVAESELERAENAVEKASINYQDAVLKLLNVQPRITVREALKFQRGREKWVKLTLVNLTPQLTRDQVEILTGIEGADPLPEALTQRTVRDIFVSLKDPGTGSSVAGDSSRGTTIALPYEGQIQQLEYGEVKSLEFELLRDLTSVVVEISFKGIQRELDIHLQQAEADVPVAISSNQISQEADLGSQVSYELIFERLDTDVNSFQLEVLNLPREVAWSFLDPGSEARLSQVSYPIGVTQRKLTLRLFLPERTTESVVTDQAIGLYAIAFGPDQNPEDIPEEGRFYTASEIEALRAGSVRLEVIPRGVGKLEVQAPSLFAEVTQGEAAETTLLVKNAGSRRLDNTRVVVEAPIGWAAEVQPPVIPSLEVAREQPVDLVLAPPNDVPVGEYEVRVRTESFAFNRRVPSEDKIFRVSVVSGRGALTTGLLLVFVLALVAGIVILGVKLTRR